MKFITDRMLGRLTRWLRLLGYDALGIKKQDNEDDIMLLIAKKEGRILLSRDRVLMRKAIKRGLRAYLVQSPNIIEQLKEMHAEFDIEFEPKMDRCSLCNSMIRKVLPSEMELVKQKEYVYLIRLESGTEFWICDSCGQVYWLGKHWDNIRKTIDRLEFQ